MTHRAIIVLMRLVREFDRALIHRINKLPRKLEPWMRAVTSLGNGPVIAILILTTVVVLHSRGSIHHREAIAAMLAAPLGEIIKLFTRRDRRETVYARNMRRQTFSFPSGHAYGSFLTYGFLAILSGSLPVLAVATVLIFLIGLSRIYLGAHFPSDVAGGWLLAGAVLWYITSVI